MIHSVFSILLASLAMFGQADQGPPEAPDYPIEMAAELIGDYEMFPGMIIKIFLKDNQLQAQPTGQEAAPLKVVKDAEVPDHFYIEVPKADVRAEIIFQRDPQGTVTGLKIIQNFEEADGKKL